MPVGFSLSRLSIRCFRGIKELDIGLRPGIPTYLVGSNNTAKSTVLNAIALALRGAAFYRFEPQPYDFFRAADGETAKKFSARVYLQAAEGGTLPAVQGVGPPRDVHAIGVDGRETAGRLNHTHRLFDEKDAPITLSPRTKLPGALKERYRDQGLGWKPTNARIDDIRDSMPDVWLFTPANVHASLYDWKTGPLQALGRLLSGLFAREEWDLKYDGKSRKMPDTLMRGYEFFQAAIAEFPFWRQDLRPRLEQTLSRYLGRQATIALKPLSQTLESWLAQQLAVSFAAEAGAAETPLERMGDGWQAAVRLASLEVLSQYPDQLRDRVVLLLEEPETHLHPHLRRKLRAVLSGLAAAGWAVISTTHAAEFVNFTEAQQIIKLRREGDEIRAASVVTMDAPDGLRWQEKIDEHGSHEFLFASRVVLSEGKDDEYGLRWYLERSRDLDGLSVTVLAVGGRENLLDFASVARSLNLPWCAVADEDTGADGASEAKSLRTRGNLNSIRQPSDLCLVWPKNLEASVGCGAGKASPEWLAARFSGKSIAEVDAEFPNYAAVCRAVAEWIAPPVATYGGGCGV